MLLIPRSIHIKSHGFAKGIIQVFNVAAWQSAAIAKPDGSTNHSFLKGILEILKFGVSEN